MQIFIWLNNQQQGPYGLEDINRFLAQGQIPINTMGWYQGISTWVPLSQVPGIQMPALATPPPPPMASSSAPDYQYNPGFGFYLGINLQEQTITIKGDANGRKVQRVVAFGNIRGVRTFQQTSFWLNTQGLEFELNDLDDPVVRVQMTPANQRLWIARIGQVCNMRDI